MEIVQIPFYQDVLFKDLKDAPKIILGELFNIFYNDNSKEIKRERLKITNIEVNNQNIEESAYNILRDSRQIIERNFKCTFLGGEHSISYFIAKSFFKTQTNPLLIVFDANANCKKISDKYPNYQQWIRALLEQDYISSQIILISSRHFYQEEVEFLKQKKILIISMDVLQEDIRGVTDMIMQRANSSSGFYISIDMNSLDPAFAPGINEPFPGGLSSREILYMTKRLFFIKKFRVLDITQINPKKDINKMTSKLAARIIANAIE